MDKGRLWTTMDTQVRRRATAVTGPRMVPNTPGVYAWYREGVAVYVGRAIGRNGLQGRVWKDHLRTGSNLSRSSFRRNVCNHLGIASTARTRIRPTVMTPAEVAPVNTWVSECEVSWIECKSDREASDLEARMKAEWKPPLTQR